MDQDSGCGGSKSRDRGNSAFRIEWVCSFLALPAGYSLLPTAYCLLQLGVELARAYALPQLRTTCHTWQETKTLTGLRPSPTSMFSPRSGGP